MVLRHAHGSHLRVRWTHLGPLRAGQQQAQGQPSIIRHHHALGGLPIHRRADATPPHLAGPNLPSRRAIAQSTFCWTFRVWRYALQIRSQVPLACHCAHRRQHVTEPPYSLGTSSHRLPVRSTYRMPLRILRSSDLLRPRLFGGGKKSFSASH